MLSWQQAHAPSCDLASSGLSQLHNLSSHMCRAIPGVILVLVLRLHLVLQLLLNHVQIIIQRSQGASHSLKLCLLSKAPV
jgi:hypothetical protein